MRLLDGGQYSTADCLREGESHEEGGGVQVILARLVNDAHLAMRGGIAIGEDPVELPPLKGHFVSLVPKAQEELGLGGHISQDST